MITVRNIEAAFDGRSLFAGIDFDIPVSSTTVVVGRNGCGKSVLLKCIAGLIKPVNGKVSFGIGEGDKRKIEVGYVFQKGGLFDSMTVYDNIAFALRRRGFDESVIRTKVVESLEKVSLFDSENRYPQELSGGMQKRVSLARSLCLDPTHMLYDDPTAGLDPVLTDSIADLLDTIRKEKHVTSLLATHDLSLVEKVADFVHLMYNGALVFSGSKRDFFNNGNDYTDQFIRGDLDGPIESTV